MIIFRMIWKVQKKCHINSVAQKIADLYFSWLGKVVNSAINKKSNYLSRDWQIVLNWFTSLDYACSSKWTINGLEIRYNYISPRPDRYWMETLGYNTLHWNIKLDSGIRRDSQGLFLVHFQFMDQIHFGFL